MTPLTVLAVAMSAWLIVPAAVRADAQMQAAVRAVRRRWALRRLHPTVHIRSTVIPGGTR